MGQIIYPTTEPRFYDSRKLTRDKILQAIIGGAGSSPATPSTPFAAQLYVPFEAGVDGAAVDATYMIANDIGTPPAAWSAVTGVPVVTTAQFKHLITPVEVGGVTYDDATGTRGCNYPLSMLGRVSFAFAAGQRIYDVIIGCWFKCTMPDPDLLNGTYDILNLEHEFVGFSEFSILQMQNWEIFAHNSSGVSATGISIERDTWYWVTLATDNDSSSTEGTHVLVYNDDATLRGSIFLPYPAPAPSGVRFAQFGNVNPHGDFPTGSLFFDNIVYRWALPGTLDLTIGP